MMSERESQKEKIREELKRLKIRNFRYTDYSYKLTVVVHYYFLGK
jgi:hypothetical protein